MVLNLEYSGWIHQYNTCWCPGYFNLFVTQLSADMVWIMQANQVIVLHKEQFQLPVPSTSWTMIEYVNIYLCFLN